MMALNEFDLNDFKTAFEELNKLFARFIERVGHLKGESLEYKNIEAAIELVNTGINCLKSLVEMDCQDTRNALDNMSVEKAKLENELKSLGDTNASLQNHIVKILKDLDVTKDALSFFQLKYFEFLNKAHQSLDERNSSKEEIKELKQTVMDLRSKLVYQADELKLSSKEEEEKGAKNILGLIEGDSECLQDEIRALHKQFDARLCEYLENRLSYEEQLALKVSEIKNQSKTIAYLEASLLNAERNNKHLCFNILTLQKNNADLTMFHRKVNKYIHSESERHRGEITLKDNEISKLLRENIIISDQNQEVLEKNSSLSFELFAYNKRLSSAEFKQNSVMETSAPKTKREDMLNEPYHSGVSSTWEFLKLLQIVKVGEFSKQAIFENKGENEIFVFPWQLLYMFQKHTDLDSSTKAITIQSGSCLEIEWINIEEKSCDRAEKIKQCIFNFVSPNNETVKKEDEEKENNTDAEVSSKGRFCQLM